MVLRTIARASSPAVPNHLIALNKIKILFQLNNWVAAVTFPSGITKIITSFSSELIFVAFEEAVQQTRHS